jgi:ubiquinone/menaquinone biosynthesis C-methylase UbiE
MIIELGASSDNQYASCGSDIPYPPLWPLIVYKELAEEVVERYGITYGLCMDIGSGVGMFGIELAIKTKLEVLLIDAERNVLEKGLKNAEYLKVKNRVMAVQADAHSLPFRQNSFNLAVSRGAIPFFKNVTEVLREVFRVLTLGGVAFVGGGFPQRLPKKLWEEFESKRKQFFNSPEGRRYLPLEKWKMEEWVKEARISGFKIIRSELGRWIEIVKSV